MSKLKLGNRDGVKNYCAYTPKYKKATDLNDLFTVSKDRLSDSQFYISTHRLKGHEWQFSYGSLTDDFRQWISEKLKDRLVHEFNNDNFSFELISRNDGVVLFIKYSRIIGGKCIAYVNIENALKTLKAA